MKIKLTAANQKVAIHTPFIRLDELLKFANAVGSGGQAKEAIVGGQVSYNGDICTMRGKKVYPGDKVKFQNRVYEVTSL
jgi:ribosome-associated protein